MSDAANTGTDLAARQARSIFYTWTAQKDAVPIEITGGDGAFFHTADGARWHDFGSTTWNANLGHAHPKMKRAMVAAAERGLVAMPSAAFPDKAKAAELLLQIAPADLRDGKAFICLSGAEANENAIKMARMVTGRRKIIYRSRSYHGATLGMMSYSGDPRRIPFDPGLPDGVVWDDPYSATACDGDLESVLHATGPGNVAAVLLEGIVGANGVFVPPPGYFRRVRELCDKAGALFICDEVLSGFGRTGRWFAVDHDDVSPDILTCAKGLTGGYAPGGAVIVSARLAATFDERILLCGLTAYAHPLTCAAIVAAIGAYRDEDLIAHARSLGDTMRPRLEAIKAPRPYVAQVRGVGLLWAMDLDDAPGVRKPASAARIKRVAAELRRRHVHLHKRDHMVFIAPPLVISDADLQAGLAQIADALDAAYA